MEEMIMPITKELLDQLLQEYEKPEDLLGDDGVLHQLTKAVVERALEGEMTHHLGYQKHDSLGDHSGNSRNGTTSKTIKSKRAQTAI
jgi:putative transposase